TPPPTPTITNPFRPMHFYDEQRVLLHNMYQAGDVVRLSVPANSNAAWTVIDLVDFQAVDDPAPQPSNSVSVTDFGADPSGIGDSANAFDQVIQPAKTSVQPASIPDG